MTEVLNHTVAEIMVKYLVSAGYGGYHASNPTWPITVGNMADKPDKGVCVRTLPAVTEGKNNRTGETRNQNRLQLMTRATSHNEAQRQLDSILAHLSAIRNETVTIEGSVYTIHAVSIISPSGFIGQEEQNRRMSYVATIQTPVTMQS